MTKRVSTTLAICAVSAGIAVIGLGRPATQLNSPTQAAAPPATADSTEESGYGDPAPSTAPGAADLAPAVVNIEDFTFEASTVATPGEVLTVVNADGVAHTLTADDGTFDTGTIDGRTSATVALPNEPGTYQFFCTIHPSMTSSITVQS